MSLDRQIIEGLIKKTQDGIKLPAPAIKMLIDNIIKNPKEFQQEGALDKAVQFLLSKKGKGLLSSALKAIKKVNNTIHDIPIIASKPLRAAVKVVGKIGGPVKTVAKIADKAIEKAAVILSLVPKENPDWEYKWRTKQTKENHALLKDGIFPNWRLYISKYAGPGTALYTNIQEDIKHYGSLDEMLKDKHWLTLMDKEGLAHDIRYALAPLAKNPAQAVIDADSKFITVGHRLLTKNPVTLTDPNILGSLVPITLKFQGDKYISNPLSFLDKNSDGSLKKPKPEEVALYEMVLKKLSQQGYGARINELRNRASSPKKIENEDAGKKMKAKGMKPRKPNPWNAHVKKTKDANPNVAFKDILKMASKTWKK